MKMYECQANKAEIALSTVTKKRPRRNSQNSRMFGRELIRERVQNLKKIVGAVFALGGPEHQPGERARAGRAMFLDMGTQTA